MDEGNKRRSKRDFLKWICLQRKTERRRRKSPLKALNWYLLMNDGGLTDRNGYQMGILLLLRLLVVVRVLYDRIAIAYDSLGSYFHEFQCNLHSNEIHCL